MRIKFFDARPPFPEDVERIVLKSIATLFPNDTESSVDTKAIHPQLQPKAHDFHDLLNDFPVGHIQVRLVVIKGMVVECASFFVVRPVGIVLLFRKNSMSAVVFWLFLRPDIVVAVWRMRIFYRILKPRM